ncbi:MAG: DUF1566 domain-containing protein [Candidatus Binatia bacterium]
MRGKITAAILAGTMTLAGSAGAATECGDVNDSGTVTASDAQSVLRKAVGQPVVLQCPPAGGVSKTGQTTCYDSAGLQIDCDGTGLDGDLQLGVDRSFTDNGDGTVTDNGMGLTWEKLADDGGIHDKDNTYTWANATADKIAALNSQNFAGHNDWRLPNRFELDSLVNLGASSPAVYSVFATACAASCTSATCSCTRPDYHWTSSTYLGAPLYAWTVYFSAGDTQAGNKTIGYYVRAVRGGF